MFFKLVARIPFIYRSSNIIEVKEYTKNTGISAKPHSFQQLVTTLNVF